MKNFGMNESASPRARQGSKWPLGQMGLRASTNMSPPLRKHVDSAAVDLPEDEPATIEKDSLRNAVVVVVVVVVVVEEEEVVSSSSNRECWWNAGMLVECWWNAVNCCWNALECSGAL